MKIFYRPIIHFGHEFEEGVATFTMKCKRCGLIMENVEGLKPCESLGPVIFVWQEEELVKGEEYGRAVV